MTRSLTDAAWPELEGDGGGLLVVPLGATEQHGPHLPLGTDTTIAAALAAAAGERIHGAVVAPALPFGSSGEHQDFPGTISIGREATELLLVELCRSAAASFERIVLLCGHGGNAGPLAAAVARLRSEWHEVIAWTPRWGGDAHAGRTETSLMLFLAPHRVRVEAGAAGNPAPLVDLFPALRAHGVRAVAANGVLGDPEGASAAEGRELFETAVDDLVGALAAWSTSAATPRVTRHVSQHSRSAE